MNAGNMTYEEKKAAAGKCNFLLINLCCCAAFICGLYSTGWCDFVGRDVTLAGDYASAQEACAAAELDGFACTAFLDNHALGFYSWQGTVPVDQVVCLSYTQSVAGVGCVRCMRTVLYYVSSLFPTICCAVLCCTLLLSFRLTLLLLLYCTNEYLLALLFWLVPAHTHTHADT